MSGLYESIKGADRRELAESYAAGAADHRRFAALYRAYIRGAYDAAGCREEAEGANVLRLAVCAMGFALVGWLVTLFFVFK